jgi:hypothetical protein
MFESLLFWGNGGGGNGGSEIITGGQKVKR